MYYIRVAIVEGEGAVFGDVFGASIVTTGDDDALFPNYFGVGLVFIRRSPFYCNSCSINCRIGCGARRGPRSKGHRSVKEPTPTVTSTSTGDVSENNTEARWNDRAFAVEPFVSRRASRPVVEFIIIALRPKHRRLNAAKPAA